MTTTYGGRLLRLWLFLAIAAAASPLLAQSSVTPHPGHFQTIWDKIPDFATVPTVTSVKAGNWSDPTVWSTGSLPVPTDVVLLKHAVVYDSQTGIVDTLAIDATGSWACSITRSTKFLAGAVQARPGGTFQCGTVAAPLPAQFTAEIVIRDLPLQTATIDPSQFGTGILILDATVHLHGAPLTTFLRLAAEPLAGSTTLALSAAPTGWKAGDRVVIPDTRQLTPAEYAPRPNGDFDNVRRLVSQSEVGVIQAISGTTVTLVAPLAFNHRGARDPEGTLVYLPHVGHLSRNLTIRSENPTGTRGHLLATGLTDLDIRYVAFRNLGRTTAEGLNNTTFDTEGTVTHIGTNQIGRYPLHVHHVPGRCNTGKPYQFAAVGNAIEDGLKWAMTVHGSSYGLVQDNVIFDAKGAGIATEDGSETLNVFDHNFIVRTENATRLGQVLSEAGLDGTDAQGRKGNGFWFRGPNNIVRNNVIADTREGIGYYSASTETGVNSNLIQVPIPNFPCADPTIAGQFTSTSLFRVYNREMSNNEISSASQMGLGTWFFEMPSTNRIPFLNLAIWHAPMQGVFHKYWNGTFDNLRILNAGGVGVGINQFNHNETGQAMRAEVLNSSVVGVNIVYQKSGQLSLMPLMIWRNPLWRSRQGIVLSARGQSNAGPNGGVAWFQFHNLRTVALPGIVSKTVTLTEVGGDLSNYPKQFEFFGYQGNASDNFRVFYASQAPTAPAPPSTIAAALGGGCPTDGLTNAQCWAQHMKAWYALVAPCTTTRLEFDGFACPTGIVPPPTPVDCVLSAWSAWSEWTPISATQEQRTRTRTVITQPANGGLPCGPLVETETRPILVPLTISCPGTQTVQAPTAAGATVSYPAPTTAGGTAPVTVTAIPSSGSLFLVGTTTVTATAQDAAAAVASCSFAVVVTPPLSPPTTTVQSATMTTKTCTLVVTDVPPDGTSGWRVQFTKNGSSLGNADATAPFTRSTTVNAGTYTIAAIWSKTDVPSVTRDPLVRTCP